METNTSLNEPPRDPRPGWPLRAPLQTRKARERTDARARVAARTTTTLTDEQRAYDPLSREVRSPAQRGLIALAALLGAAALHGGIVVLGILLGTGAHGPREPFEQEVQIKVKEPPPPPPPPPEVKAPEPTPKTPEKPRVQPKVAKAPPPEPVHTPPPRVVGLSLESTTEGGSGPSFAVGNTREGRTANKAEAPQDVPKETPPPEPAAGTNQVAHHIPVEGVVRTQPKRLHPEAKPPYPETLKSQGVEANVIVTITVEADGKVSNVKISKSSGFPEFDEAARKFVAGETYEPGTRDGIATAYPLTFTVRFRLEDNQ